LKKNSTVIIIVTIVLIVLLSAISFLYLREAVAVSYSATLTVVPNWPWGRLDLAFHTDNILYNCKVHICYLATNGSWVDITQNIGTVDSNENPQSTMFKLTDYPTGDASEVIHFTNTNNTLNILKIDAYGYLTPYIK